LPAIKAEKMYFTAPANARANCMNIAAPGSPWSHSPEKTAQILTTDIVAGLTENEAARRLEEFGPNELPTHRDINPILLFLSQFNQPLIYILLASAAVTAALHEWIDSAVIFGVTLVNAVVGYIQEANARRAIAALSEAVPHDATVFRNRQKKTIPASLLVPGDLVLLKSGDKVPADIRLAKVRDLSIDESALTGESVPVQKSSEALPENTLLADRYNMAYSSSMVTYGSGTGLVTATGEKTEIGKINTLISTADMIETPLTRSIASFSNLLLWIILSLATITFVVGFLRGQDPVELFLASVALAVAAIPEGLPAALTITLAIGVSAMAKRNAIVRKLPAVETLGSTTIICSDKTGTLTKNQMTVTRLWSAGTLYKITGTGYSSDGSLFLNGKQTRAKENQAARHTLLAGLLCNDSRLIQKKNEIHAEGDPTEAALLAFAMRHTSGTTQKIDHSDVQGDLIFLGLQGMIDPPRPEAITAIAECRKGNSRHGSHGR